jgi:hypothetical protein
MLTPATTTTWTDAPPPGGDAHGDDWIDRGDDQDSDRQQQVAAAKKLARRNSLRGAKDLAGGATPQPWRPELGCHSRELSAEILPQRRRQRRC